MPDAGFLPSLPVFYASGKFWMEQPKWYAQLKCGKARHYGLQAKPRFTYIKSNEDPQNIFHPLDQAPVTQLSYWDETSSFTNPFLGNP